MPATHVPRPQLAAALSGADHLPVTLVCAPAGYGKTQTLADWARRTHGPGGVAWVTMDRDDDAARFWAAVTEAVATCARVPQDSPLRRVAALGPDDDLARVEELTDALEGVARPVHLVIDDLHEATAGVLGLVEVLLRHQPPSLRLVLSSRLDPPLPLARLRVAAGLAELRADDLRFSVPDARELLRRAGVALSDQQLELLVDRTEGWAVGLRLAAMSLAHAGSAEDFLANFAGEDRAVADYLVGEVLSGVPDELRRFLRLLSVCEDLPTGLAVELSGRADAGGLLARLERETALVTSSVPGRRAYRMHSLLRSYLVADLDREQPAHVRRLHVAAAGWYVRAGEPVRALEHAHLGRADDLMASILRTSGVDLLLSSEQAVVERSLEGLPAQRVRDDPWLCLLSAMVTAHGDRPALAHLDLRRARAVAAERPDDPDLDIFCRLAEIEVAAMVDGHPVPPDENRLEPLPDGPALEAWARAERGRSQLFTGRIAGAAAELDQSLLLSERYGLDHLALRVLADRALTHAVAGDFPAMVSGARRAVRHARAHGWSESPALLIAHGLCAVACLTALRPADATAELAAARRSGRGLHDLRADRTLEALEAVAELDAGADRSRDEVLLAAIRRCRLELAALGILPQWAGALALLEFPAAAAHHHHATVREILAWADRTLPGTGDPMVLRAHLQLTGGRPEEARQTVDPVIRGELACLAPANRVDAWLVRAGADLFLGRTTAARRSLARSLMEAVPDTTVRPYKYADPRLLTLLIQHIGTFGTELEPLVDMIVRRVPPVSGRATDPGLTARERTVLTLLQSHRSIDEIADDLTVSANTVKTHVRSVYAKLGVNSRRGAVVAARERGLV